MGKEKCPCCHRHCSVDELSCGRGMEHFGKQDVNSAPKTLNEQVIMDLRKCGHMLHHNRDLNANDILTSYWEGKDAVKITYEFTNNAGSAESFDLALSDELYQDGVGLESSFISSDDDDWGLDVKIKPGIFF